MRWPGGRVVLNPGLHALQYRDSRRRGRHPPAVVEVHLSNVAREFRRSVIAPVARGRSRALGAILAFWGARETLVEGDARDRSRGPALVWRAAPASEEGSPACWSPTSERSILSGFTGSSGQVVVTPEHALFLADSRYHLRAGKRRRVRGRARPEAVPAVAGL